MDLRPFTDHIADVARQHGYILGLDKALDLLRQHGVCVSHPARKAVYEALMTSELPSQSPGDGRI